MPFAATYAPLPQLLPRLRALGAVADAVGLVAYTPITGRSLAIQTAEPGTLAIGLSQSGLAMGDVKMSASGLVHGDSVRRVLDLTNSGYEDVAAVALTGTEIGLSDLGAVHGGGTVHLLVTLTLPGGGGTDNRVQDLVSAFPFSFTGIGRDVMPDLETGALAGTGGWSWPHRQGG